MGIGVGNVNVLVVGGVFGRFENLPAGDAFREAFNSENDCQPQQVIISKTAYHMVKGSLGEYEQVGKVGNYIVKSLKSNVRKRKYAPMSMMDLDWKNERVFEKFKAYIPAAVVPHLKMPEQAWVGELRQVTIMFMSLPFTYDDIHKLGGAKGKKVLRDIHESIKMLQEVIYKYQGSLNKFLVDDKGSTVMVCYTYLLLYSLLRFLSLFFVDYLLFCNFVISEFCHFGFRRCLDYHPLHTGMIQVCFHCNIW